MKDHLDFLGKGSGVYSYICALLSDKKSWLLGQKLAILPTLPARPINSACLATCHKIWLQILVRMEKCGLYSALSDRLAAKQKIADNSIQNSEQISKSLNKVPSNEIIYKSSSPKMQYKYTSESTDSLTSSLQGILCVS